MIRYRSGLSPEDAVERLKAAISEADMRLVSHIDGQANAAMIGAEVPADQILEVFRPDFALRVWEASKPAGIEIPLRIHVYQDEFGAPASIAFRTASEAFTPYGSADLYAIGKELDAIFFQILAAVPEEGAL